MIQIYGDGLYSQRNVSQRKSGYITTFFDRISQVICDSCDQSFKCVDFMLSWPYYVDTIVFKKNHYFSSIVRSISSKGYMYHMIYVSNNNNNDNINNNYDNINNNSDNNNNNYDNYCSNNIFINNSVHFNYNNYTNNDEYIIIKNTYDNLIRINHKSNFNNINDNINNNNHENNNNVSKNNNNFGKNNNNGVNMFFQMLYIVNV